MTRGVSAMATESWIAMAEAFEALGRDVERALEEDDSRVSELLAERDALLAQLTTGLGTSVVDAPRAESMRPLAAALERASAGTATLIARVAERTDALRSALRDMSRGADATKAYQAAPDTRGFVNARR